MIRLIPGTFIGISIVRKRHPMYPPLKNRERKWGRQSEFEKADEFNGQFTDVFNKTEHNQVHLLDRSVPFMEEFVVTKEGVTKLHKGLNSSKALGPDELNPRVLKGLATELGPPFVHLFGNRLIRVKYQVNGLLQTFAPCSRSVTGLLHAMIARFP